MLKPGELVEFDKIKAFKYIRGLGSGGTGQTYLFSEDITDMKFAIKKYSPIPQNKSKENFERFIDEIKILFKISNPHIVRIYNYYLYPEFETGYLQMEYVEGTPIDQYVLSCKSEDIEKIFLDSLSAFEYLESLGILHRDIKPDNILVDENNDLKIIDFGFGKVLTENQSAAESIFLNWPVSRMPEDVERLKIYDFQTEIYFLGYLFKGILEDVSINFKYQNILENMTKFSRGKRYKKFSDISKDISSTNLIIGEFTEEDKDIYLEFADCLVSVISIYRADFISNNDLNDVIFKMEDLLRKSVLERYIQDNSALVSIFVKNNFKFFRRINIERSIIEKFYEMLLNQPLNRQKVILDNLFARLSSIKVEHEDDDLPF